MVINCLTGFVYGLKPLCIAYIVIGNAIDLIFYFFLRYLFYFFCRHPRIYTSGFANRTFQHYRASSNYGIAVHNGIVHNNSSHANQYIIMHRTTMYNSIMPYRNIIANDSLGAFVRAMYNSSVLYVYFIAYAYTVYIAAQYCVKPYTAFI